MFKKLIEAYRNRYFIAPIDLADTAETNRLHILFISPILFVFGLGNIIFFSLMRLWGRDVKNVTFIYFGIFTLVSIFIYIFSRCMKKTVRENSYYLKTIPFYVLLWISLGVSLYNFYILGQPYNGVISYCLTGLLSLIVFSFSPVFFLIAIVAGLCFLIPGVYKNFGLTGLLDTMLVTVLEFCCSLYKRRIEKKYIMMLKRQKKNLEAKTFGNFTLLYENKVVRFSRTKSSELLAYLIYKKGSSVQTKELLAVLYGEHADSAKYGANLRNLIVDIRQSLSAQEIQNFFITEYNNFRINPEALKCDYYDFLAGNEAAIKSFAGEFMSQYSWAEDVAGFLEMKATK